MRCTAARTTLAISLFASLNSTSVLAGTYDYTLPNLAGSLESCQERAPVIAESFAQSAGVAIVGSGCIKREYSRTVDFYITYSADELVQTIGTYDRTLSAEGEQFPHSTFEECLNDIPRERDAFVMHTGLEPFLSYCYTDGRSSQRSYGVGIEAVGDPEIKPFMANLLWFGRMTRDWSIESNSLLKSAAVAGWKSARVWGSGDVTMLHIAFRYYATEPSKIVRERDIYRFRSLARCEQAVRHINDATAEKAGLFSHSTCSSAVGRYYLESNHDARAKIKFRRFGANYPTIETCNNDLNRLKEAAEVGSLHETVGGFCSEDNNGAGVATLILHAIAE